MLFAPAADYHDVIRIHSERSAIAAGGRRRRGNATLSGDGRVLRHVGRDPVRHLLNTGLLLRIQWFNDWRTAPAEAQHPRWEGSEEESEPLTSCSARLPGC